MQCVVVKAIESISFSPSRDRKEHGRRQRDSCTSSYLISRRLDGTASNVEHLFAPPPPLVHWARRSVHLVPIESLALYARETKGVREARVHLLLFTRLATCFAGQMLLRYSIYFPTQRRERAKQILINDLAYLRRQVLRIAANLKQLEDY